jgi:ADP-ribosylglycohydrolase
LQYFAQHTAKAVTPFSTQHYFEDHWVKQYDGWQHGECRACGAWIDTMVKHVLVNTQQHGVPLHKAGGHSNAQVIRFPAALGVYEHEGDLSRAAQESTRLTNHHQEPILAAAFWARVAFRIVHGDTRPYKDIMLEVAGILGNDFLSSKLQQAIDKAAEATDASRPLSKERFADDLALTSMARLWDVGKSEPIKVGKASPTEGTLPGAIYFILKYPTFADAARANAMVGGDNASRSIPIGMVMGAREGVAGVPQHLLEQLGAYAEVRKLVGQLPLVSGSGAAHTEL